MSTVAHAIRRAKLLKGRESVAEKQAIAHAERMGSMHRKMNGLGFNGWPDQLFTRPPWARSGPPAAWVEFKKEGEELEPLQAHVCAQLRERGQEVLVCDHFLEFVRMFHSWWGPMPGEWQKKIVAKQLRRNAESLRRNRGNADRA